MQIIEYSDKYKNQAYEFVFDILENEFGRHSESGRPDVKNITEVYQEGGGNFWLAIEGAKIVGTIGLKNCGNGQGYLARFLVDKNFRRMGVGAKLLAVLLEFARKHGFKEIFLTALQDSVSGNRFYLKNGFRIISSWPETLPEHKPDEILYKLDL